MESAILQIYVQFAYRNTIIYADIEDTESMKAYLNYQLFTITRSFAVAPALVNSTTVSLFL